jgi:hypothetical protein
VQAKQGHRGNTVLTYVLTLTIVRFLGPVQSGKEFFGNGGALLLHHRRKEVIADEAGTLT